MVDAGRILIMPKGIWSNLVSYEMLDVVTQDNIAYLARQSSVGVSPKNDSSYTYWQPFGTSVTPDGETIIMNSAGNITANIDNKSLIYDDVNMYVKVAIDGSTIKYDSTHGYLYVDASNFNINDLNNIAITSPENGQTLVYDSTTQKWKNGEGSVSPIDNLTSNSTTQPLSANQGRVLNNQKLEKEIISDAWNSSTTYAVGKYCIYNNSLWKCLVQHSGQTPTEGTYWTKVTVANEITNVNNSIGDISGFTNDTYDSIGAYIQYCIDNAYLPDVKALPLIPTMTSDTAPSGVASASSVNTVSNHIAYHAFDNDDSTLWSSAQNHIPAWIKYKFPSKVCVRKAKIKPFKDNGGTHCKDFVIQGSNDDSNWTDLYSGTNPNGSTADIVVNFANSNKYQYYRCYMANSYTSYCALATLQLYGY